jgi:hypothetical protein
VGVDRHQRKWFGHENLLQFQVLSAES